MRPALYRPGNRIPSCSPGSRPIDGTWSVALKGRRESDSATTVRLMTPNGAFAAFGKIGVVVGAVLGLFALWEKLNPVGPDVEARVFAAAFVVPPGFSRGGARPADEGDTSEIGRTTAAFRRILEEYGTQGGYWRIEVANTGKRAATALQIALPEVTAIRVRRGGPQPKLVEGTDFYVLGALPANSTVEIEAWTRKEPGDEYGRDVRVNHLDGVADVTWARFERGHPVPSDSAGYTFAGLAIAFVAFFALYGKRFFAAAARERREEHEKEVLWEQELARRAAAAKELTGKSSSDDAGNLDSKEQS